MTLLKSCAGAQLVLNGPLPLPFSLFHVSWDANFRLTFFFSWLVTIWSLPSTENKGVPKFTIYTATQIATHMRWQCK